MPITEQDIKLLASQRMTDTPDGAVHRGGFPVSDPSMASSP